MKKLLKRKQVIKCQILFKIKIAKQSRKKLKSVWNVPAVNNSNGLNLMEVIVTFNNILLLNKKQIDENYLDKKKTFPRDHPMRTKQ